MKEARERLGPDVGVQGNLESAVLLGTRRLSRPRPPTATPTAPEAPPTAPEAP